MERLYRIQEFAELAGVTVKALHHYDRLGLLRARRTSAAYRIYSEKDLERLEQIVALKFLGFPLKQIGQMLDRGVVTFKDALRMQRTGLEEKRQLLSRAIHAIEQAERASEPDAPAALRKIIEVIGMDESIDAMKRYYTQQTWPQGRGHYADWPSAEWKNLYRDVEAALRVVPESPSAEALAIRWMELAERDTAGDPDLRLGSLRAWNDRHYWPPELHRRLAIWNADQVWEYMSRVFLAMRRCRFPGDRWADYVGIHEMDEWRELFLEVSDAVEEDSSGKRAQELARRWQKVNPARSREAPLFDRWKELASGREDLIERQLALFSLEKLWGFIGKAIYIRLVAASQ